MKANNLLYKLLNILIHVTKERERKGTLANIKKKNAHFFNLLNLREKEKEIQEYYKE